MIEQILTKIITDQAVKGISRGVSSAGNYLASLGFEVYNKRNDTNISYNLDDIQEFIRFYKVDGQLAESPSNLYYGSVAVGGKIFLTIEGVEFHPHNVMQNYKPILIPFEKMKDVGITKQFLVFNNCTSIFTIDGHEYRFVI